MHILSNTAFSLSLIKLIGHSHLTADSPHGKKNPLPPVTLPTEHSTEMRYIGSPKVYRHLFVWSYTSGGQGEGPMWTPEGHGPSYLFIAQSQLFHTAPSNAPYTVLMKVF